VHVLFKNKIRSVRTDQAMIANRCIVYWHFDNHWRV